jgi:hypothetical protein
LKQKKEGKNCEVKEKKRNRETKEEGGRKE